MKKTLTGIALAVSVITPIFAQTAAPASEHTLTGNATLASEYRFRGVSQTAFHPALQGGVDYAHSSGFYAGNWNSNVDSSAGYPEGNLEMDFYGGYKAAFGDFGLDVGGIYYYYPGSSLRNTVVTNKEIYLGGSWKFLSAKWYYSVDDYFSTKGLDSAGNATTQNTKGTNYLDLAANFDLGNGWGVNGHYGALNYKNVANGDYNDWKLGVTKDINGWVLGAAYIGTDAKGGKSGVQPYRFLKTGGYAYDAGKDTVVVSVTRNF